MKREKRLTMRILRTRLHPPLKAQDVAVRLGVNVSTINNWESGRHRLRLTPTQVKQVLELYQCSLEELIEASEAVQND